MLAEEEEEEEAALLMAAAAYSDKGVLVVVAVCKRNRREKINMDKHDDTITRSAMALVETAILRILLFEIATSDNEFRIVVSVFACNKHQCRKEEGKKIF